MTEISLLVGIIGLCLTCFGLGYQFGKDSHHPDDKKQK